MSKPRYAELHAHSAYSFLDGVSQPAALARQAARLGLDALALTDHNGLYGIVQFAEAAAEVGLPTVFGAELTLACPQERAGEKDPPGDHLLVLATGPDGYRKLAAAISRAHLATGEKGRADFDLAELSALAEGDWFVLTGCRKGAVRRALEPAPGPVSGPLLAAGDGLAARSASQLAAGGGPLPPAAPGALFDGGAARREVDSLIEAFGRDRVAVEITDGAAPGDSARCDALAQLAEQARLPLVATGNVHYATPSDAKLAASLAAVRARSTLSGIDGWLPGAGSQFLLSPAEMASRHWRHPGAVEKAAELGRAFAFDLHLLAPDLPPYPVPAGHDEASWLRVLTWRGFERRYGHASSDLRARARAQIERELTVIKELHFPGYFLIVHDIVDFCRTSDILCQGRGSAANSAVCYALGITAVDAVHHGLLFERFLASERDGPPDIDVDIESARREEVIQYVYERYGRMNAALVANVISYRPRSALQDAAKALGYDVGQQRAWAKQVERWGSIRSKKVVVKPWGRANAPEEVDDDLAGIPDDVVDLAEQMMRLPRHLGIHPGGMVLCDRPVIEVCPVEHARMDKRTVLQWDKDDCAAAGLVKFDLLGLGMLGAIHSAFDLVRSSSGEKLELHSMPQDDPAVYDLLCAADTVGVFQVESRAQMATLPRLRPRTFYDIVVEVALIRPGPIQGGSVHPYIERKRGRQKVEYDHPLLEPVLEKTLGVPLFQEQLMQIAITAAGFNGSEADQLRRAMGSKRSPERMAALRDRLFAGMAANGIGPGAAERIYAKLRAFADFGFPESHSFSFAYLVYASAWLKVYHPAAFYAGLLANQPMGFYSPQSLVADARRHGLTVLRPDVAFSQAKASVEWVRAGQEDAGGGEGAEGIDGAADGAAGLARDVGDGDSAADGAAGLAGDDGDGDSAADSAADGEREAFAGAGTVRLQPVARREGHVLGVRLGLASVRGLGQEAAERIVAARERRPFTDLTDLAQRSRLTVTQTEALAASGACDVLGISRREAMWQAGLAAAPQQGMLPGTEPKAPAPELPHMGEEEIALSDAWSTGITAAAFPTEFVRPELDARGIVRAVDLPRLGNYRRAVAAGVVTHRQRPGTAKGVTFLSLEDESGMVNVVCRAEVWQRHRRLARTSSALIIAGRVETRDGATNLLAEQMWPLPLRYSARSRDFQ